MKIVIFIKTHNFSPEIESGTKINKPKSSDENKKHSDAFFALKIYVISSATPCFSKEIAMIPSISTRSKQTFFVYKCRSVIKRCIIKFVSFDVQVNRFLDDKFRLFIFLPIAICICKHQRSQCTKNIMEINNCQYSM